MKTKQMHRTINIFAQTGFLIILAILVMLSPAFAGINASVSTSEISVGKSFVLQLQTDSTKASAVIDLSPLQRDFNVLGNSRSWQTNIINGVQTNSTGWEIILSPKSKGRLTIPALKAGTETSRPIIINVVDSTRDSATPNTGTTGISISMTADGKAHYVQEKIPVTVRITTDNNILQASLEEPTASGFILTQQGEDKVSSFTRNGRRISVIKRQYLLEPLKSGSLTVPPITLQAVVSSPVRKRSPFPDIFGNSLFGSSFFNGIMDQDQQVIVRSKPLQFNIKPRPGQSKGWFLPAKKVLLTSEWKPENPIFHIGKTVTRTIRLSALGASKEQLPDINVTTADGAKVYLDQSKDKSINTPEGIVAIQEYSTSIVPTKEGKITLPAISVKWWDTVADVERTAVLPSETFFTEGAPMAGATVNAPAVDSKAQVTTPSNRPVKIRASFWNSPWLWGVVSLFILLVITIGYWVANAIGKQKSHRQESTPMQSLKNNYSDVSEAQNKKLIIRLEKDFQAACTSNNKTGAYTALNSWLYLVGQQNRLDGPALLSLFPALSEKMEELEQYLYGGGASENWNGKLLLRTFKEAKPELLNSRANPVRQQVLPPLYPELQGH